MLSYYAKRPFLSPDARHLARQEMTRDSAETLFRGLSLLRGTALKMVQQLSLETDLLPESACRELAKSYHQVPPINRALVRKVVGQALGRPPEKAFRRFDLKAFAAASLGRSIMPRVLTASRWRLKFSIPASPRPSPAT